MKASVFFLLLCGCGGCGKSGLPQGDAAPSNRTVLPPDASHAAVRDLAMWSHARDGGTEEDLAALAVQEGGAGLVEAAGDPALTSTAIRAMPFACGWTMMPYLATTLGGEDEALAKLASASLQELAARPRRAEDAEDVDELREGCEKLGGVARDKDRAKDRRIGAIRALRMMPCPPWPAGSAIPTDLDAK